MRKKLCLQSGNQLFDFDQLDIKEQSLIKGGDFVTDLINNLFIIDPNVTQTSYNIFVAGITELVSTSVGLDVLTQLYFNQGNQKIHVNGDMPSSVAASAQYLSSSNTIRIGNLDTNIGSLGAQIMNYGTIAHELYHSYQDIVQNFTSAQFTNVNSELDAGMFAQMYQIQFDIDRGINYGDSNSHVRVGINYAGDNSNTNSHPIENAAFDTAWYAIFENHSFTLQNYNSLIQNFVHGSTYIVQPNATSNTFSDFGDTYIDELFNSYMAGYSISSDPYNTNGGSGGGGNGSGYYSFSVFMQEIQNMQNQGWVFYTSTTETPATYFYDPLNPGIRWMSDPGSTNYNEASFGDFYQYYNAGNYGNAGGWGGGSNEWGFSF